MFGRAWLSSNPEPKNIVNLIHGLGEHSGRYAHVAEALNGAGYHLAAFDLRGHGLSEGKRGHAPGYDQIYDDIQSFLKQTQQRFGFGKRPFLYGHSLGGSLVINFALKRDPELSGVIATAPALATAFKPPKIQLFMAKGLAKILPAMTISNDLKAEYLSRNLAVVKAYQNDILVHDHISVKLATELFERGEEALAHAQDWQLPLLLMHGTADRITSHQSSKIFAQNSDGMVKFLLWEDFYHELHNDIGQENVLKEIITWLDQIENQG